MASADNKGLDDFLSKVDELEAIVKGFQACDDETVKDYIQKADELITKVKKDKDELIDKEVAGDGDEDLPKTKTGFSKTVINKAGSSDNPPDYNDVNYDGMSQEGFMKALEEDAQERFKRKRAREKVAEGLKEKGNEEFRQGNYEKALEFYTQAIGEVKDDTKIYTNRAQTYIKLGKYTEALEDCDWALRVFPNCLKAHIHMGRAHLAQKDYDKARECYKKALECDPKKDSLIKDYLSEVDRTEKAEQEEKDAEKLFLTGKPEDVGIVEIIERVRKPEQLPVFYSGGFRVLKSLIITTADKTLFRTHGGLKMISEHANLSRCLSASPRSLSQEELDMLVSSFNMFTEACRDNDKNIELILQVEEVPKKCVRFLEVKIKGQGKILKHAIINWLFTLSQVEIGRKLIVSTYDIPKLLTCMFTMIRTNATAGTPASGLLNNLALDNKFKAQLREKIDESVLPAFELLLREGSCQQSLLPNCINMMTNLSVDKTIKDKLLARKETWENCSKLIVSHRTKLEHTVSLDILESCLGLLLNLTTDTSQFLREFGANICDNCLALIREKLCQKSVIIRGLGIVSHRTKLEHTVSLDILESCLGLLLNLTTDTSQFLREFGANICDNCLALIWEKLCQKSVIIRGLGTIGHILPHSIPAVDLICEKGGTVVFLEFIKAQDPDTLKSALKALTACTQINELSRSQVVDCKGLGALIKLLKNPDEGIVGNAALCLGHCTQVPKVCTALTKTDIIKELLVLARDGKRPAVQQNCAILIAKLAQGDTKHLERLRELHGIEILHSCMKYLK